MHNISLGYIGLSVSDLKAWKTYAEDFLGVMEAGNSPAGVPRLRTDDYAWRIALEPGEKEDIAYVGFEVAGPDEFAEVKAKLASAGIEAEAASAALLAERGVVALFRCNDPDGLPVEIFYGPTLVTHQPFVSPRGVQFVTGEQGLGHIVLTTTDLAATRRFYLELLGFRQSDTIRMQIAPQFALDLEFYFGNPRHHTIAIAPVPAPMPKRMHHMMLQVATLDQVGHALDRAETASVRLTQTLGRHSNDKMVSFYAATPSGFEVEYGFGAIEVDDQTWRFARHDKISSWGHKRL